MKQKKIYNFNIILIAIGIIEIITSLILKFNYGKAMLSIPFNAWIWIHIIISIICIISIFYHLKMHWGGISNWVKRIKGLNAKINIALVYVSALTLLFGLFAFISFVLGYEHNFTGGIHGKLGIAFIILLIFHTLKRLKWFKGRKSETAFVPVVDDSKCIKCKKCVNKCPADVFTFENKKVVVKYEDFCIQCKKCVKICPKKAIS